MATLSRGLSTAGKIYLILSLRQRCETRSPKFLPERKPLSDFAECAVGLLSPWASLLFTELQLIKNGPCLGCCPTPKLGCVWGCVLGLCLYILLVYLLPAMPGTGLGSWGASLSPKGHLQAVKSLWPRRQKSTETAKSKG